MESMAAIREVRRAGVGARQGPVDVARAAPPNSGDRDSCHRCEIRSAYEIYAHVLVAELRGLPDDKIATIVAGQRPSDLTREEAVAYDVASALVSGGVLPELTYRQSIAAFGEQGTAEFINLVGLYCMVSVTLNGFDVPVPEVDARS